MKKSLVLPSLLAMSAAFAACSSGSGDDPTTTTTTVQSEVEPNDDSTTAGAMTLDRAVTGAMTTAGDADWWSIDLALGEILQVEILGTRFDLTAWDANSNVPTVSIFDADGTSILLRSDTYSGDSGWGNADSDIARFVAPADATYFVVVEQGDPLSDGGAYAMSISLVTPLGTAQSEVEAAGATGANDTFGTAETVTAGTIKGFHVDDESDWYKFTISAESLVRYTLFAHRNGVWSGDDDYFDPSVEVYDSDGTTLISGIDDFYFYDSSFHHVLTTPGDYYIHVTECCGDGDAAYTLDLSIDSWSTRAEVEPNETTGAGDPLAYDEYVDGMVDNTEQDVFTFSGTAGDTISVEYFDSEHLQTATAGITIELRNDTDATLTVNASSEAGAASAILSATATYNVLVTTSAGTATPYAIRVHLLRASTWEVEPNDDSTQAIALDSNDRAAGIMDGTGDNDVYSFSCTADTLVRIACFADDTSMMGAGDWNHSGFGSSMDPVLTITDSDDNVLATSTSAWSNCAPEGIVEATPTLSVAFVPPANGTYYVTVTDSVDNFGAPAYYTLQLR